MPSKAPIQPVQPQPTPTISGKWLIIGFVMVTLMDTTESWIFRYYATHRIAQFWGPTNSRLIRDAPQVTLSRVLYATQHSTVEKFDMSQARGLAHLRNALLENQSYDWPAPETLHPGANWFLEFREPSDEQVTVAFTADCRFCWTTLEKEHSPTLSCEPIAAGLLQIFTEVAHSPEKR